MLFMTVFTFEPEKRDEIIRKREQGLQIPEGLTVHGEWTEIGRNRAFCLIETGDPQLILRATMSWSNLGHLEVCPVMETEEIIKLLLKG